MACPPQLAPTTDSKMNNIAIPNVLHDWQVAQNAYITEREAYRLKWAQEYLAAESVKPAEARKAKVDVATSELRLKRDNLETAAAALWQQLLMVRGPIESSQQPGQKF